MGVLAFRSVVFLHWGWQRQWGAECLLMEGPVEAQAV